MTTFTWTINSMQTNPSLNGQTNVVTEVAYTCTGTETINNVSYTASINGVLNLNYVQGDPFIAYSSLTQTEVLGWLFANGVNEVQTQNYIQMQLNNQSNPLTTTQPLPWITN